LCKGLIKEYWSCALLKKGLAFLHRRIEDYGLKVAIIKLTGDRVDLISSPHNHFSRFKRAQMQLNFTDLLLVITATMQELTTF